MSFTCYYLLSEPLSLATVAAWSLGFFFITPLDFEIISS